MFYVMEDFEIANYGDDWTPFSTKLNHRSVVEELEIFIFSVIYMASEQLYESQY